jgi:hypothetical protein
MGYPSAFEISIVISQSAFAGDWGNRFANELNSTLGVRERAVFFQEGRARQEHVRELRGFVQKQVLNDDALHAAQRRLDVLRVRIGLHEVLTLDVHAFVAAVERRIEHVGNPKSGLGIERHSPFAFK